MQRVQTVFAEQEQASQVTDRSFQQIGDTMQVVSDQIKAMDAASRDLAKNAEVVQAAIQNIAAVTEESAASTEEVAASTEEQTAAMQEIASSPESLARLATRLQEALNRFRV
jgi:methyl-accepting chemotaxis protein